MSGAPIVGYRAWRVVGDELSSLFVEQIAWPAGERMVAECMPHRLHSQPAPHDAPCQQCDCGIYARTTLPGIFDELWRRGMASRDTVVGAVLMFGVTYHGKSGPHVIRAQYAQPLCLLADDAWYPFRAPDEPVAHLQEWRAVLGRVSQRYGLPVVGRSSIEQYAAEFGEPLCTAEDERVTPWSAEPRWRNWWLWGSP